MTKEKNLPPVSAWQINTLRLTAFPSPDAQFNHQNWWESLVGELPEQKTSQPRTGEIIEEGSFENGKLVLSINPLTMNWVYTPREEVNLEQFVIPVLGAFPADTESFFQRMNQWLAEVSPALVRLAFGAVLLQPLSSRAECYRMLSNYVPVEIDAENSSDFLYRINRKRNSKLGISNLVHNRLSKWSALQYSARVTSAPTNEVVYKTPYAYATILELDINTDPDLGVELQSDALPEIFRELVELGIEIAEKGDIA